MITVSPYEWPKIKKRISSLTLSCSSFSPDASGEPENLK
jgi:hypothetical protein